MKDVIERVPPHNLEAEQAVLAAMLVDREAIARVMEAVDPASFYRQAHATIFETMLGLFERGEPVDLITLRDALGSAAKLEEVGGYGYLLDLASSIPTTAHAEYYAKIVADKAMLRALIRAGSEIVASAFNEDKEVDDVMDSAERLILEIGQKRASGAMTPIKEVIHEAFETIEARYADKDSLLGATTGFYDLDHMLSGFQPSDLLILAARPAMGKTSLALNFCRNVAVEEKKPVLIYSLEMSKEQLVQRLLCAEATIDSHRLRTGYLAEQDWSKLTNAIGVLSEAPIFIDDTASISVNELRLKARRIRAEHGDLGLIMVDYLQLMTSGQSSKGDNRTAEMGAISRGLKQIARELHAPVVALSQLSRAVESRTDKRPMLSDLRESGCLTGESQIFLPDEGRYERIDALMGQTGFRVLALNPDTWRLEPREVTHAFPTGRKPVYRLTTRLGRTIRATGNHKFLAFDGWQRLDALRAGDRLALPRRLPSPHVQTMSDAELALLGHLIGDGCTLPRQPIHYTTIDPGLAQTVIQLAGEIFGDAIVGRIEETSTCLQVYLAAREHLTHGKRNPIAAWLDDLGVFGLRSAEKRVPAKVFAQPADAIARFLRHLWATDGCIHLSEGAKHYANLYYASSSEQLARQVQALLLRLDVNATLRRVPQGEKGLDHFQVWVSGQDEVLRFLDRVGGLGTSKEFHAAAIRQHLAGRQPNTNRDVIPKAAWGAIVKPARVAVGLTERTFQQAIGTAYCGATLYKSNLGRDRALRVADVLGSEELARLAASDVYWDEIVTIEPDGEEEVYDLTVDGLHNFLANDIVVHNSIEQDADIVMFIYRDEYYNPDSDKKATAEVIVAKHRNGPVGQVDLYFEKNLTKFQSITSRPFNGPP